MRGSEVDVPEAADTITGTESVMEGLLEVDSVQDVEDAAAGWAEPPELGQMVMTENGPDAVGST